MQIRAIFQHGTKQVARSLGYSIPSQKVDDNYKYWNADKQIVKGLGDKTTEINEAINQWRSLFNRYATDCSRDQQPFSLDTAIAITTGQRQAVGKYPTLRTIVDAYAAYIKPTHDANTHAAFAVVSANIADYEKKKATTVRATDINTSFYNKFAQYLIEHQENFNPTINKKLGKIATAVKWAVKEYGIKVDGTEHLQPPHFRELPAGKFPLLNSELLHLHGLQLQNQYHQMVLDAFLLATEVGLRHSDIKQLRTQHVCSLIEGDTIIRYIQLTATVKGRKENSMVVSDRAALILDKYMALADTRDKLPGLPKKKINKELLFQFDYSQSTSRVLKTIFEDHAKINRLCEIAQMQGRKLVREQKPLYEVISFHMARNTYITRLLDAGLAPVYVKDNVAHSDLDITMRYYRGNQLARFQATRDVLNKL